MNKSNFVLNALKILGLEEILKLSEVLHVKQVPLKKAAGEELVVWDDDAVDKTPKAKKIRSEEEEGQVLHFPKKTIKDLAPPSGEGEGVKEGEEGDDQLLSSEVVLWQREISRSAGSNIQKLDAFKGYRKSTEMYVVKTHDPEGKDKIRFASTNGVLVNKKQA